MDNHKLRYLLIAGLLTTVALAGCAAPEEAGQDDGIDTDPGTGQDVVPPGDEPGEDQLGDTNETGGNGNQTEDNATGDERIVMINDAPYRCDDTLNFDGVCDEFEYAPEAETTGSEETFQTEADGSVTIDGRTYVCDDTNNVDVGADDPPCELYVLSEEA